MSSDVLVKYKSRLIIAIAALAGLAIGFILVPRAPTVSDPKPVAPEVRLLARPLSLDERALERALAWVRSFAGLKLRLLLPDGQSREYFMGRLGVEIDKVRLARLVRDARDATSPLRQLWQTRSEPLDLPVPLRVNSEQALPTLLVLKDEFDRQPVDARLDLEKRELVREVKGRKLDADATLLAIEKALKSGQRQVEVVFAEQTPKRVAERLGNVEFGEVLGYFETPYDRSERHEARTYNLRLAASKIDGYVLLPNEVFDFNDVVGPRDEANGYKVARVIAEGEMVDGIGGGTCQISGTLHGAAFFAGLEIVERYPHTRPSSYIKMGLDATVVYPTINMRLKNPYAFPVVLHEVVKNGVVRAEILGPRRARTVTLIRRIDSAIPYEQIERPDPSLAEGVRVLSQRGIPGFKLHRYRILREGAHAVRERWNDVYPPTAQIVRVGTATQSEATLPAHDAALEYVADELLVMTQLVANEGDGDEVVTREWREPGPYGKDGWTAEAGMPYFETRSSSN
jgi:vancomycin resistance protein YoaR